MNNCRDCEKQKGLRLLVPSSLMNAKARDCGQFSAEIAKRLMIDRRDASSRAK